MWQQFGRDFEVLEWWEHSDMYHMIHTMDLTKLIGFPEAEPIWALPKVEWHVHTCIWVSGSHLGYTLGVSGGH